MVYNYVGVYLTSLSPHITRVVSNKNKVSYDNDMTMLSRNDFNSASHDTFYNTCHKLQLAANTQQCHNFNTDCVEFVVNCTLSGFT